MKVSKLHSHNLLKIGFNKHKIFLIINLSCLGDVILTNTLPQNIKLNYPDSKVVFITDKPFIDAARYQMGVDEVYYFDKRHEHKGFIGLIKFINNFKYKNKIFAAFTIYGNDRGILLSWLLNAKYRISTSKPLIKFLLTNIYSKCALKKIQDFNGDMLSVITKKDSEKLPIKIIKQKNTKNSLQNALREIYQNKQLIALTLAAENNIKNMPINDAVELIKLLNSENKIPVLLGAGSFSSRYVTELKKKGCISFVDLINVTSIVDLMDILAICNCLISIDTGTFHLGYAIGIPTIGIFYNKNMVEKWGPDETLYNHTRVIYEQQSPENIIVTMNELLQRF